MISETLKRINARAKEGKRAIDSGTYDRKLKNPKRCKIARSYEPGIGDYYKFTGPAEVMRRRPV